MCLVLFRKTLAVPEPAPTDGRQAAVLLAGPAVGRVMAG